MKKNILYLSICSFLLSFAFIFFNPCTVRADGDVIEESDSEDEEETFKFKKGDTFVYDNLCFRVLTTTKSSSKYMGTVEVYGFKKGIKDINIPVYVTTYEDDYKFKITSIAKGAFKNCTSATNFWIAQDSPIKVIPSEMCSGCSNLVIAQIRGSKITKINKKAFFKCKKLRITQIYSKNLSSVGVKAFSNTKKGMHLQVSGSSRINKYKKKVKNAGGRNINCYVYYDWD